MADIDNPQIKKYQNLLGAQYTEFSRAIGLAAHGVGVGSFVYLRRIFENLIEATHKTVRNSESSWNEEKYEKSRMVERIKLLDSHLPKFLVEQANIYTILSKGIHELAEDECLAAFTPLKIGIELILDEQLEAQQRQEKLVAATKALASIHAKHS